MASVALWVGLSEKDSPNQEPFQQCSWRGSPLAIWVGVTAPGIIYLTAVLHRWGVKPRNSFDIDARNREFRKLPWTGQAAKIVTSNLRCCL
ncbi:MAG: hypothetical protein ACXWFX_00270 [Methylobacter sp.]